MIENRDIQFSFLFLSFEPIRKIATNIKSLMEGRKILENLVLAFKKGKSLNRYVVPNSNCSQFMYPDPVTLIGDSWSNFSSINDSLILSPVVLWFASWIVDLALNSSHKHLARMNQWSLKHSPTQRHYTISINCLHVSTIQIMIAFVSSYISISK